jgi:hypothetical protein
MGGCHVSNNPESLWIRFVLKLGWSRAQGRGPAVEGGDCADRIAIPHVYDTACVAQQLSDNGTGSAPPPDRPVELSEEEDFWLLVMKYSVCC